MPYTGQPGSPEPMAYIPRTEEAPTAWKWGEKSASLSQKESAHASQSDPICTSEGCPKFQSMGLDYEPYNDYNHIPYSGSPGYHSPISFIPRSDQPPIIQTWADIRSINRHRALAQKQRTKSAANDPTCTSVGCEKFQTIGLEWEPYNDINHVPYSG